MVFNHLHFSSERVGDTQEFYESYFGFRLHSKIRDTTVLTNEHSFLLAIDPIKGGPVKDGGTKAAGNLHFGFCLDDADSVENLYRKMEADHVAFAQVYRKISENAVSFYCYDPAGNCVEVGWYRSLT